MTDWAKLMREARARNQRRALEELKEDLEARREFEEALLKAMSTPVDMRFHNWLEAIGVPGSWIPSPLYGTIWSEMSEEEKDRYLDADPKTTD